MEKIIYTQKQLSSYKNFKKNVLGRGNVANILDNKKEQIEFRKALMEKRSGGITNREMREIIGSLHHSANDHIDKSETRKLASEYIGGSRFMLNSRKGVGENLKRTKTNRRETFNRGTQLNNSSGNFASSKPTSFGSSGIKLVR